MDGVDHTDGWEPSMIHCKSQYFAIIQYINGVAAFVVEGFGLGALQKRMPQPRWTMPDRPYRLDGGELGGCELGTGRAGASWSELDGGGATWSVLG